MEELYTPRFSRREHSLHQTAVGRALWRQVRAESYAAGAEGSAAPQSPYETSYDVARGYCCERSIVRP
jgi:hypothetical protein